MKFNSSADEIKLANNKLLVYPMKTCRQSNNVDCGVFILHFVDEFVGFNGSDEEQSRRPVWAVPLNVEEKRNEISNTLKGSMESAYLHNLFIR
jgi:Ulp1 family protease